MLTDTGAPQLRLSGHLFSAPEVRCTFSHLQIPMKKILVARSMAESLRNTLTPLNGLVAQAVTKLCEYLRVKMAPGSTCLCMTPALSRLFWILTPNVQCKA